MTLLVTLTLFTVKTLKKVTLMMMMGMTMEKAMLNKVAKPTELNY